MWFKSKAFDYKYIARKSFMTNKYQKQIIRLAVLPAFAFTLVITAACVRFRYEAIELMLYGTRSLTLQRIEEWFVVLLVGLWACFLYVVARSIRISGELVGSFERLNRQMDKTIRGELRVPLKARDHDELAKDLLERINIFIDNLPEGPLKVR